MMGQNDPQMDFFTQYAFEKLIPQDHELVQIHQKISFSFVRVELQDLYDPIEGRPSWDPEVLFRACFLQYYDDLSDRDLQRHLQVNLLYRWFCGLTLQSGTPEASTLSIFRTRVKDERLIQLFDRIVHACNQQGLLSNKIRRVDATHILADVAKRNQVNVLKHGQRVIKREVGACFPEQAHILEQECPDEPFLMGRATEQDLQREADRTRRLLGKVTDRTSERIQAVCRKVERILSGDPQAMASLVDPDARTGHKSPRRTFVGYKAHIGQDESGIITSVQTLLGNESEGQHLEDLLAQEESNGIKAEAAVADGLYESEENYRLMEARGTKAYFAHRRDPILADVFVYDAQQDVYVCPANKESLPPRQVKDSAAAIYQFRRSDCAACPLQGSCLSPRSTFQRVYVSDVYRRWQRLRADPEAQKALRQRKRIEPTFGTAKTRHGLTRARYRGKDRVAFQVVFTFLVMNAKKIAKLLKSGRLNMETGKN